SLASIGKAEHPVARKGAQFIVHSVRPDGSWPIDTNLSTWVTTLAINALAAAGELEKLDRRVEVRDWLLRQQYKERHPYTGAAPGGWAWTPLPGGVPDADDTAGAVLALVNINIRKRADEATLRHIIQEQDFEAASRLSEAVDSDGSYGDSAAKWLRNLQNADGGWPTFCRGWGALPFDRSGPDLTAHALRALVGHLKWYHGFGMDWRSAGDPDHESGGFAPDRHVVRGLPYLARTQRPDGSWLPPWVGTQQAPDDENPTYGTARVLAAYRDLAMRNSEPARRGVAWLLSAQNADGGWGGAVQTPSSIEETALAVEVLLGEPGALATGGASPVAHAPGSPPVAHPPGPPPLPDPPAPPPPQSPLP